MAIRISGTTGIDLNGGSIANAASVNSIIVPEENGEFITSQREDSHISHPTMLGLISGDVSNTDEITVNGMGINLYTGNGTTLNVVTNVDTTTQWGNDTSKKYGGLIIVKPKSQAGDWSFVDSVRGVNKSIYSNLTNNEAVDNTITAFNNNGFTLGNNTNSNTNNAINVAYTFQTTHRRTGITNHGWPFEEHYNPSTGFFILKWTGSGQLGHLLTHSLGRKISYAMWKNLGTTDTWVSEGDTLGIGKFIVTPGTAPMSIVGSAITFTDKDIYLPLTNSDTNANANTYIMYGWADAIIDSSSKLIGNFETGIYQGTGAVGNIIKTKAKPLFVLTRGLDHATLTNDFVITDVIRGNTRLFPHTNALEDTTATLTITKDGFNPTGNTGTNNMLGVKYFYLVVYDNDNGSGLSKYKKTQDTSNSRINNGVTLLQNGNDENGKVNSLLSKNELLSVNTKPGRNHLYYDKNGILTATSYAPNVDTYNGFGDYLDSDTNKWYKDISVFKDDFSNGLGTWVADEALGATPAASVIVLNGELRIVNNAANYGAARNSFTTIPGKKYKFTVRLNSLVAPTANIIFGSTPRGTDIYIQTNFNTPPSTAGTYTGTFIATSATTHVSIYNQNTSGNISTWDNISVYPVLEDDKVDLSNATQIIEGRSYLNTVLVCDHNSKVVYEEELPKTIYLNSVRINNLESVKGNAVTNSTSDNTKGKLLKVGDFGIGGSAVYKQGINLNTLKDSGFYYVNGNCLNNPTGGNGWLQVIGAFENGSMMQIFTSATGSAADKNRVFVRNFVNLNYFSPWQEQASYETGSFTPEAVGSSTNGVSTYTVQQGNYVKIGKLVYFTLLVIVSAMSGAAGGINIRGLPYIVFMRSPCTISYIDGLTFSGIPTAYVVNATQYLSLMQHNSDTAQTPIPIDSNYAIMISGSYHATV